MPGASLAALHPPLNRLGLGLGGARAAVLEAARTGIVLDFVNQEYWGQNRRFPRIDAIPGWTYSRSGVAYDLNGTTQFATNVPRRTSAGLLVENGATNSTLWSQDFTQAAWVAGAGGAAVVTGNAGIAPDGTLTASLLDDNSAVATLGRNQGITVTSSTNAHSAAVFMKAGTSTVASWRCTLSGGTTSVAGELVVDLTNGNAQWRSGVVGTSFSVVNCGNGWYRAIVTITDNASGNTQFAHEVRPSFAATYSATLDSASTGTALFWGAHAELNSSLNSTDVTSYIPTTTASAARGGDTPLISGLNYASAFSAIVLTGTKAPAQTNAPRLFTFDDTTTANRAILNGPTGTTVQAFLDSASVNQANQSIGTWATSAQRIAATFATNNVIGAVNGALGTADATVTLQASPLTRLAVGYTPGGAQAVQGPIQLLALVPRALTNAELQAATA